MPDEKKLAVLNLSNSGRKYRVRIGWEDVKDKEGKIVTRPIVADILPNQKAVMVPESEAKLLLGKKVNGQPNYPDLVDASTFTPQVAQNAQAAMDENAKLMKENAELKAKLADKPEDEKKYKGGSKK